MQKNNMTIFDKIDAVYNGNETAQIITDILKDNSKEATDYLYKKSDEVCKKSYGNSVFIRGIIEMSNICARNCNYCGIRAKNSEPQRYRLSADEIIELAEGAYNMGYRTLVLQCGEEPYYDDKLAEIITQIKSKFDMAITLSVGEKSKELYKEWKIAGADRFLLRIETTDKDLYNSLHPDGSFENRIECLYNLKELGYEVGTGIMIGLPNQTIESIAKDIMFFKDIDADMIGMGPFIAHHQTPLKDCKPTNFNFVLKVLAVTRLVNKTANIPATTSMGTLKKGGREEALLVGANVIMPNYTPQSYRKFYQLYDNKICINEDANESMKNIKIQLKKIGKDLIITKGFRVK